MIAGALKGEGLRYVRGQLLGEGTWGLVYLCTRVEDGLAVAVKRIKPSPIAKEGVNFTAIREVKYLRRLRHENIIELLDVYVLEACVHLVFEVCATDLEKVIKAKEEIFLRPADIKSYLQQSLLAVRHCHAQYILHRDLKPSNLLITSSGVVKLTDFGLARTHGSPNRHMTAQVVTNWYRAPELLFGATLYSAGVDIWAMGCIFAEIILRYPLFPGETDLAQLGKIFNTLGTPSETSWPGITALPHYVEFENRTPLDLNPILGDQSAATRELLMSMLEINPNKRCDANEALAHEYFTASPQPTPPNQLQLPAEGQFAISLDMRAGAPARAGVNSEVATVKEEGGHIRGHAIKRSRLN